VELPEWVTPSRNELAAYIKQKSVTMSTRFWGGSCGEGGDLALND